MDKPLLQQSYLWGSCCPVALVEPAVFAFLLREPLCAKERPAVHILYCVRYLLALESV